ncbi:hypothetical protein ILYODFUR_031173 [Ilyodon furcidens]|uniref:Uncharacterized protein n=1 Tax=Ilyodon furcidens TaxID=33524 RepID=A0ABV0UKI8_9TELE
MPEEFIKKPLGLILSLESDTNKEPESREQVNMRERRGIGTRLRKGLIMQKMLSSVHALKNSTDLQYHLRSQCERGRDGNKRRQRKSDCYHKRGREYWQGEGRQRED